MAAHISIAKRVLTSTCILLVTMLAAFNWALATWSPAPFFQHSGFAGRDSSFNLVGAMLPKFFACDRKPQIVFTGSSLFMYPAVRCDDEFEHVKTRYDTTYICDHITNYPYAKYFSHLLMAGQPAYSLDVANLATAGGLISDQYEVLKKCCATGKKPRLLICDISPREFLDNNQPDPAKTPVYVALVDYSNVADLLDQQLSFNSVSQAILGRAWNYFGYRNDSRIVIVNAASWLTGHPADLLAAKDFKTAPPTYSGFKQLLLLQVHQSAPEYVPHDYMTYDLAHYRSMYLPVEDKKVVLQMHYLEQLLAFAHAKQISVVFVQMPLSAANRQLLPSSVFQNIYLQSHNLATKYGATYFMPEAVDTYSQSDFEDSAHLNASGGHKFFTSLANVARQSLP